MFLKSVNHNREFPCLLVLLAVQFQIGTSQVCPFGWLDRAGSDDCYFINTANVRYKFPEAVSKCETYQGHLVTIDSNEEKQWIQQQLRNISLTFHIQNWWIGIVYQNNTLKWIDGRPLNKSMVHWEGGQSNSTGPCFNFLADTVAGCGCQNWNNLLCERSKSVPLLCDVDNRWTFINGSCFKTYTALNRSWEDAKELCDLDDAQLASAVTFEENSELWDAAKAANTVIWLGLQAQQVSGQMQLTWLNGTRYVAETDANKNFWGDNQPGTLRNGTCAAINGQEPRRLKSWIMANCTEMHGYACERPQGVCEPGWLTHQRNCFKLFTGQASWNYANLVCTTIGGQLVKLASPSDQLFIQRYIPQFRSSGANSFWIGINDYLNDTGPFRWTDGTAIGNISFWAQNPPPTNTRDSRDCGFIDTSSAEGRWMMTSDCTQTRSWVCTVPINTPVKPMPQTTPSGLCDPGWYQYSGSCYYFSDAKHNWTDAQIACKALNADLVVIKGSTDQTFVNGHIAGADYYIGLSDRARENGWTWVDGTLLGGYTHWAPGEPNNHGNDEDCGGIYGTGGTSRNGLWNDYRCTGLLKYICQKSSSRNTAPTTRTTTRAPVVWSARCGPNWEERPNSDYCYQFHDEAKTYNDAAASCQGSGGYLVSIGDQSEQSYLAGRARSMASTSAWTGATDTTTEGGWSWSDGTPFTYINWNAGEPNNYHNIENCGSMFTQSSRWNDNDCSLRMAFICKKTATTYTTPASTTMRQLSPGLFYTCPFGWIAYSSSCYLTSSSPASWTDARTRCKSEGGELASIANAQENNFLASQAPGAICRNIHNDTAQCLKWAEDGECDRNPFWMLQNCRHSCEQCLEVCKDIHKPQQCQVWAQLGECEQNPSWMLINCALSCNFCPEGQESGVWIGLNDRQSHDTYVWSDETPVRFSNWAVSQPRSGNSASCVSIRRAQWYDSPCETQMSYVCKKPLVVSAVTSLSPLQIGCPPRALGYEAFCYQYVDTMNATWQDAENFCVSAHGHLAAISTMEVQFFLVSELNSRVGASHYWIGLSDKTTPGTYTWSNGGSLQITVWSSNHTGNERGTCVGLRTARPTGLWENVNCSALKPFICALPRSGYTTAAPTTTIATTTPAPCSSSWSGFQEKCYKAFSAVDTRKTWMQARDFCQAMGGDLASIHNASVNSFIRTNLLPSAMTNALWIGLTDAGHDSRYVWSDSSPFDFASWSTGEPNNQGGGEDCVEIPKYTQGWNDNSCYISSGFICSILRGKPLITTMSPPPTTPIPTCESSSWLLHGGFCYFVSPQFGTDAKKTWFEARRYCQQNGAELASINSEEVNAFLVEYVTRQAQVSRQFWIGLNELEGNTYTWTDRSPLVFQNWGPNEPNDAYGGQSCVNIYSNNGKWNDDNCNDEFNFFCKKTNGSAPINPVPTPLINGGCPVGFTALDNKCLYVGGFESASSALNWTEARDKCRSMPSAVPVEFASITSRQEEALLMTLLENVTSDVYIGLNDMNTNSHFVWVSNEEVSVTYWATGQPSETYRYSGSTAEDCVVVQVDQANFGKWNDVNCHDRHGYVCQTLRHVSYPRVDPVSGGCNPSYYKYRDSCYATYPMAMTWADAQTTCQLDGANLVSFRDIHELVKVETFIYLKKVIGPVWIGMFFNEVTGQYAWVDGWPVTLTQWDRGEPSLQGVGTCVAMVGGMWNDTSCNDTRPFACKSSTATPPPTTPPPPGYCVDPSWTPYGEYCYYANPQDAKSWPEANYMCRRKNMELVSIHSESEQTFVISLSNLAVSTLSPYRNPNWNRIWIGLQRDLEGGFRWSDYSPFDFVSWNAGEPNNFNNGEDCVELQTDSSKWNDLGCMGSTNNDRGYVCKAKKIMPSTTTTLTSTPTTAKPITNVSPGISTTWVPFTAKPYPGIVTEKSMSGNKDNTLSGGQVAGIVIGVIGFIVIVGVLAFVFRHRLLPKPKPDLEDAGFDNALYTKTQDDVSLADNGVTNGKRTVNYMSYPDSEDC